MFPQSNQDTIAALATAPGEGGVAVVRISGSLAPQILEKLFHGGVIHKLSLQSWKSHHLYHGRLLDLQNNLLDECLAVWMKAPHSFTGEEVVEFHLHGGKLISLQVLKTIYELGARPATAGEFSQRAFLNGKIDLTQAEAIADMIAAKSEKSLQLAQAQWQGDLSGPVRILRKALLELLVNLEAAVDFPEEDVEIIDREKTLLLLQQSAFQLKKWIEDYELGRILREGLIVVLLGKPNVGKSSLLNTFISEEAAIVHDEPGTTRDAIERQFNLEGISIRLIDTAGIHEASGIVEKKGIERSQYWLNQADLALVLLDTSSSLTADDSEILKLVQNKKCIFILNKMDLPKLWDEKNLHFNYPFSFLSLSAKTGENISHLKKMILDQFGVSDLEKQDHLLINQLRHQQSLKNALDSVSAAVTALEKNYSPEFIATDLQRAARFLGEMIGELTSEHILDEIFSRFCIGK